MMKRQSIGINRRLVKPFNYALYQLYVMFFGASGGRLRDEDVVAFQALDAAYKLDRKALCFVINDLPLDREPNYEGEATLRLQQLLSLDPPIRVFFF